MFPNHSNVDKNVPCEGVNANYGIRRLLEAERRASKTIEEARTRQKALMKRARDEAKMETDALKEVIKYFYHKIFNKNYQHYDAIFQNLIKEMENEKVNMTKEIEQNTIKQIKQINDSGNENRDRVCFLKTLF